MTVSMRFPAGGVFRIQQNRFWIPDDDDNFQRIQFLFKNNGYLLANGKLNQSKVLNQDDIGVIMPTPSAGF